MRVPQGMRVLILHSERAGRGRFSKANLVQPFERAGHEVRYRSMHKPHWKRRLAKAEVIVVAGGDGTVAKVAIALAKHGLETPLAVIPGGKANNIARALGASGSVSRLARTIEQPPNARLAIGLIRSPWGKVRFVESAGIGRGLGSKCVHPIPRTPGRREARPVPRRSDSRPLGRDRTLADPRQWAYRRQGLAGRKATAAGQGAVRGRDDDSGARARRLITIVCADYAPSVRAPAGAPSIDTSRQTSPGHRAHRCRRDDPRARPRHGLGLCPRCRRAA